MLFVTISRVSTQTTDAERQETGGTEGASSTPTAGTNGLSKEGVTGGQSTALPLNGTGDGVSNKIISVEDLHGKKTVSSAIVTGPASIGVPSFCFQRVDPGPCALDIVRVYYDYKTFTCKAFSYSGKFFLKI